MQKYIITFSTLLATILISGCLGSGVTGGSTYDSWDKAKDGDAVKVAYELKIGGELIDSGDAFEFTLGSGSVIPGFDKAVRGMAIGETKEVTLTGTDAYTAGPLAGKTLSFKITLIAIN